MQHSGVLCNHFNVVVEKLESYFNGEKKGDAFQ